MDIISIIDKYLVTEKKGICKSCGRKQDLNDKGLCTDCAKSGKSPKYSKKDSRGGTYV